MRVFVTGAAGFVGSAVVRELVGAGHEVLALARSDASAAAAKAMGAVVHRGSLEELDGLRTGAAAADAVAHLAFNHDFSKFAANAEMDRRAIAAIGDALQGTDKPLLVTSGLGFIAPGRVATETDQPPTPSDRFPRRSEAAAADLAARGVRATAVRLAPSTHGEGDHGFVPILIKIAREKGKAAYVGDGANRWPGVHRRDAARLYRLALERGAADGPYHATDEEGVPFKAIAEAIGEGLGVPVESVSPEAASGYFGWFGTFAALDMAASSVRTRAVLDWQPDQPGLLADIATAGYFAQ